MLQVEAEIKKSNDQVWNFWTQPSHIVGWNFALDTWCCPSASNDVRVGGKLSFRMQSKDGSLGFDLEGVYDHVRELEFISYTMADGRKVEISFNPISDECTKVVEKFDPENVHSLEQQQGGWQSIMNNFKYYAESH